MPALASRTLSQDRGLCQSPQGKIPHSPSTKKRLAHHNGSHSHSRNNKRRIFKKKQANVDGVSTSRRILTTRFYRRYFNEIRQFLKRNLGLTQAEREGILRLIPLYVNYGMVYPKASQVADDFGKGTPGTSESSFWRAIRKLKKDGMIEVINRYLDGWQISNEYRLDKMIVCLVRCVLEHGDRILDLGSLPRELYAALHLADFWRTIRCALVDLTKAVPIQVALAPGGGTP